MARPATLALALTASLLVACAGGGQQASVCVAEGKLTTGDTLPGCELPTLDGEGSIVLDELVGTTRVINFWASWCLSCLKEMPVLDAFDEAREDVEVIGVDVTGINGETRESGLAYFQERGVGYQSLVDEDGGFYSHFGTTSRPIMPLTVVIDASNRIKAMRFGEVSLEILEELVA